MSVKTGSVIVKNKTRVITAPTKRAPMSPAKENAMVSDFVIEKAKEAPSLRKARSRFFKRPQRPPLWTASRLPKFIVLPSTVILTSRALSGSRLTVIKLFLSFFLLSEHSI